MSEPRRGYIQHALHARYETKDTMKNLFDQYVQGFMDRALEISSTCPRCGMIEMYALSVWREQDGVHASWKCQSCGNEMEKTVSNKALVDDFNFARKSFVGQAMNFEEWRTSLKFRMSKANIPCHEKPDGTIVGKFGGQYREMDLDTQKKRWKGYLAELRADVPEEVLECP